MSFNPFHQNLNEKIGTASFKIVKIEAYNTVGGLLYFYEHL